MIADNPAPEVDMASLAAQAAAYMEQVPVGEGTAAKLSRLLLGFLETEVLPQANRAAEQGLDPTPLLAVVTGVLRLYTDALEHPRDRRSLTPHGQPKAIPSTEPDGVGSGRRIMRNELNNPMSPARIGTSSAT